MSTAPHSFASRLKDLREHRRMSKTGLGKAVGVTTTCVWNWEEGNTEPRSENLAALAKALAVSPEYLELGRGSGPSDASAKVPAPLPSADGHDELDASGPLTIAEAKAKLALSLGVPESSIEISVRY